MGCSEGKDDDERYDEERINNRRIHQRQNFQEELESNNEEEEEEFKDFEELGSKNINYYIFILKNRWKNYW